MTTAEALRAGLARIRTVGWRQGVGWPDPDDAMAKCALLSMPPRAEGQPEACRLLADVIGCRVGNIADWNDDPSRTVEDVIALYERAIALAEAEEGKL